MLQMGPPTTHPDYDANAAAWLRARDVLAGEDAVKAAGIWYLLRLDAQTDEEYDDYKSQSVCPSDFA